MENNNEVEMKKSILVELNKKLDIEKAAYAKLEITGNSLTNSQISQNLTNKKNLIKIEKYIQEVQNDDYSSPTVVKLTLPFIKEEKTKARLVKTQESMLSIADMIVKYNMWQVVKGRQLFWFMQREQTDEYGNRGWDSIGKEVLLARFPQLALVIKGNEGSIDYRAFDDFCRAMTDGNRGFFDVVKSFTLPFGKVTNGKLNIMEKNFAKPSEDSSVDYHWFFDLIFASISGGEGEDKKEALEKLFLAKYQHPENSFLPGAFCNDAGATFKDLLANKFARGLFGGNILYNGTIEHLLGKYNALIAGVAFIHLSEIKRDKVNIDKLKSIMNAPTIYVEAKYEMPYVADNTGMIYSAGNGYDGNVTVSGTNQDRRLSIFSSTLDGLSLVIEYIATYEGRTVTRAEAEQWVISTGQHILSDATQIGKWLSAKINKYGDITYLRPVQGEAYLGMIDKQRASWTSLVETVFEDTDFDYIRVELLKELVQNFNRGGFTPAGRNMILEIEKLIKDRKYNIIKQDYAVITGIGKKMRRDVWRIASDAGQRDNSMSQLVEDESNYIDHDNNGRQFWTWKP